MNTTTYHMTLCDGHKVDLLASSAGEAIEQALRRHRGCRVVECHSGLNEQEAAAERANAAVDSKRFDRLAIPGVVKYDVPYHEPYPLDAQPSPAWTRRLPDNSLPMFNDDEIIAESKRVREGVGR